MGFRVAPVARLGYLQRLIPEEERRPEAPPMFSPEGLLQPILGPFTQAAIEWVHRQADPQRRFEPISLPSPDLSTAMALVTGPGSAAVRPGLTALARTGAKMVGKLIEGQDPLDARVITNARLKVLSAAGLLPESAPTEFMRRMGQHQPSITDLARVVRVADELQREYRQRGQAFDPMTGLLRLLGLGVKEEGR